MKRIKSLYILGLSLLSAAPLHSQQRLNETLSAEGEFMPVVRPQQRIYLAPGQPDLQLPASSLSVDTKGKPTAVVPGFATAPATGFDTLRLTRPNRGYVQAGLGSFLNSTLSAGYKATLASGTTLSAWLQHNSSTGFRAAEGSPRRRLFNETVGLNARRQFGTAGALSAELLWHSDYFNYYNNLGSSADPSQTLTDISARLSWQSPQTAQGFSYSIGLSHRCFAYRRFYSPGTPDMRPPRENHTSLSMLGNYRFTPSSALSLGINADLLIYSRLTDVSTDASSRPLRNYGRIALNPAYTLLDDSFSLRAGLKADFTPGLHRSFSTFHIAPDVMAGYTLSRLQASLSITGGVELSTLASLSTLDLYQSPLLQSQTPLYSPIDARLRFTLGSFSGFSIGASVGYKISHGTLLGGLYPMSLYNLLSPSPQGITSDIKGYSIGAHASYTLGQLLTLSGDMTWQPQDGSHGYFNGFDRPRWLIDSRLSLTPWSTLRIDMAYQYRGVRRLYTAPTTTITDGTHTLGRLSPSLRLPDATLLSLKASYTFASRYSLWCEAANILSSNYSLSPVMPSEGIAVTAGFGIIF